MTKDLEFHPYANIFPLIEGEAFAALRESVRKSGLREPIVLHQGQILDGRNRYRACRMEGVKLRFVVFGFPLPDTPDWVIELAKACKPLNEREMGLLPRAAAHLTYDFTMGGVVGADALAYVIDKNLHRRHLDDGQRSMVAAKLATMGHGGKRVAKAKPEEQAADRPVDVPAPAEPAGMTQAQAAQALNVSERNVRRAKAVVEHGAPELVAAVEKGAIAVTLAEELARLPKDEQAKVAKEMDVGVLYSAVKPMIDRQRKALVEQKKAKRAAKEQALGAKQKALPNKKFGVIYADPAWKFRTRSEETGMDRAPENHYPTMTTEAICALPVQDIASSDCVLFMWATAPMIRDALAVMERWGFDYKSQYIWWKYGGAPGLGYWGRIDHEILLIGTRGSPPCPAPGTQWSSVQIEAPGEHSAKPEKFAELIEVYFPTLPKIELNARKARPGWDVWGSEAPEVEAEPVPAKPTKKAKKGSAHDYAVERARREDRIKSWLADLPDDLDDLISIYRVHLVQYDRYMSAGDAETARFHFEMMDACTLKANGGDNLGVAVNPRPNAVRAAGVAPLGTPPRFGETGHWIVEHRDVRAIVEVGKHGAAIYALDFNRPFPSPTGYHSLVTDYRRPGESSEAFGQRMIEAAIAYKDPNTGRPRPLQRPESAYRLQLGEDGRLVRRRRGVPVDRSAPPLGLDAGLLDGLDTIRERWKAEDRAKYSGQKLQGKRTCPVCLHLNDKIVAVNGQMLTPVADFPTAGAYAYTESRRVNDGWADEWCFVEAGENLDREPDAAPAEDDHAGIPAFLKREPARDPDTVDMFEGEGA